MNRITVFHGSFNKFTQPALEKGKYYRDFGIGFYITEQFLDALSILNCKPGFVYEYELTIQPGRTKTFQTNFELLSYIIKNRTEIFEDEYDFVIGKTLPNCAKVFKDFRNKGIALDNQGLLSELQRSPYEDQICIKTELGLRNLKLIKVHEFTKEDFE